MVHHEPWYLTICRCVVDWISHNRILLYIALVLTLSLLVEVFDIKLVSR